jgi:hypothetical protein
MYFSERRKQGLGSLRPGYFIGGPISNLLMGNAVNWGLNKGINYLTKSPEQRETEKRERDLRKFAHIYVPEEKDNNNTNKTPSTFKGAFKGGLMNLLATAMLGPLMGPLALTVGRGLMNKSKGLGFTGGDGGSGSGPGPKVGPKTDWYTGSDEEDKDNELGPTGVDAGTADIQDFADIMPDRSNGDSGGSGGSSSDSRGGAPSHSTRDLMATGGRVSYSKGGIASLWQR